MSAESPIVPGVALVQALFARHRRPCVATVGTFDGVHAGHRALLAAGRRLARERGLGLTAVTFSPRPERLFATAPLPPDLCSVQDRVRRLHAAGADAVVVVPFSRAVAMVSAEQFVRLLDAELGMQVLCVGEDFALGRGRRGDVRALRRLGYEVVTPPTVLGDDGRKLSSTDLRHAAAA